MLLSVYEIQNIDKEREYTVAKANALVLNARYQYNLNQQKMIAFICSKIKPLKSQNRNNSQEYQLEYEFQIADYIRITGMARTGDEYNNIKKTIQSLRDRSYWLTLPDGSETIVSWINKATISKGSGLIKYRIDEDMAPYIFGLKENYLSYGLENILSFTSGYAIRIYELIKAYYDLKRSGKGYKRHELIKVEWQISIEEFRHLLMLDTPENANKLKRYPDLRRKVLLIAQREINDKSDMKFEFEPIKKGNKVVMIKFIIENKTPLDRLLIHTQNKAALNKNFSTT